MRFRLVKIKMNLYFARPIEVKCRRTVASHTKNCTKIFFKDEK